MTNNKNLTNAKTLRMLMVVVISVSVITTVSFQNAMATICPPMCADIDVEEAEEGNSTMSGSGMNQTTTSNMSGTN